MKKFLFIAVLFVTLLGFMSFDKKEQAVKHVKTEAFFLVAHVTEADKDSLQGWYCPSWGSHMNFVQDCNGEWITNLDMMRDAMADRLAASLYVPEYDEIEFCPVPCPDC